MSDNLSSFAGPFKAENMNNKILKNVPSQCCCIEAFETPDTFLLSPRPSMPPLCNFTQASLKLQWTNLKAFFNRFYKTSLNVQVKISFHEWELCQVLLSWLHSLQYTFCLSDLLLKTQILLETMADWESSSQHEFELSFHYRLELQALEGRICELSYPVFKL